MNRPRIVLNQIDVRCSRITYDFTVSQDLNKYFDFTIPYFIEYTCDDINIDLKMVPESVLVVPFMCNLLPVVWLKDAEIEIPEIDYDFYQSIELIKKGFAEMYNEAKFRGGIRPGKIVKNHRNMDSRSGVFFSGGVDAWCTLLAHLKEKPALLSIWGADISVLATKAWENLVTVLRKAQMDTGLPLVIIKSSFREILLKDQLSKEFISVLHDEWWYAAQHGPGIIGHAAPIAYIYGMKNVYIASSNCPEDGKVWCSSDPTIDNFISYANCNTIHDGFELTRQKKIKAIVESVMNKKVGFDILLHTCWKNPNGENCCRCEKCMRSILAIWVEGGNPIKFGYKVTLKDYAYMKKYMLLEYENEHSINKTWINIQNEFIKNKKKLSERSEFSYIKWIEKFDFTNPDKMLQRKLIRCYYRIKYCVSIRLKRSKRRGE